MSPSTLVLFTFAVTSQEMDGYHYQAFYDRVNLHATGSNEKGSYMSVQKPEN